LWFLAFERTINNWTFSIATVVLVLALPRIGVSVTRPRRSVEGDAVPLELLGIDRPFTSEDVATLDRAIGFAGTRS
jgi:hypothetical protein